MQNEFFTPQGRGVTIKIIDEHILFYHTDNIVRQERWVKCQIETGNEITEEERECHEFYYIDKKRWIDDFTQRFDREDNFHAHMKMKVWFTDEMYEFINKFCSIN